MGFENNVEQHLANLWQRHVSFQMIDIGQHICGDCQEVNLGLCISVNCEESTSFSL